MSDESEGLERDLGEQVTTLRERLFKLGAVIKESVRRIVLSFPESYPWKAAWYDVARSLGAVVT